MAYLCSVLSLLFEAPRPVVVNANVVPTITLSVTWRALHEGANVPVLITIESPLGARTERISDYGSHDVVLEIGTTLVTCTPAQL